MTRNVLILGCGRSGTSIFGELFESLPGFEYFDEPHLDEITVRDDGAIAVKVPTLRPGESAPPGCAAEWPALAAAVPEPRSVFWQVRHPLDTICSLRVGIEAGWRHHPRPPDWEHWLGRTLVEQCAHHWATINTLGYAQVREFAAVSRFEALIAQPVAFAADAAAQAGLEPSDPEVHDGIGRWAARVQDTNNAAFVEARRSRNHSRPDHRRRVGRWEENLTLDDLRRAIPIVADAAASLGYSLPHDV